jgi:outer membrane receptor for ferrienterochelin and colicins
MMSRHFLYGCVLALLAGPVSAQTPAEPSGAPAQGLNDKSLEELMTIDVASVTGATRHEQRVTEAPSSVTVITAADIETFGWRTIAEVLRSVRGFYTTYDRNYSYLGVRGFGRPTDYNNRVLFLIDGHRLNDNVYDATYIGTEGAIDVDLIDRIEVIRGPGSALYGGSAFFGVVNIITRRGGAIGGVEGALQAGSQDTYRVRATAGWATPEGRDLLVSATRYQSGGAAELFYPEFNDSSTNFGQASHLDADENTSVLANARIGGVSLQAGYSTRTKHVPTAAWSTAFADPRFKTNDNRGWVDATYDRNVAGTRYTAHGFVDRMGYSGDYPNPSGTINFDLSRGTWLGGDFSASRVVSERHRVTGGIEYRDHLNQEQRDWDLTTGEVFVDDRRSSRQAAVFVQDEITLARHWTATVGARADWWSVGPKALKPRAGLVYRTDSDTAFKVLYGEAFRAPNVYELYYTEVGSRGNPALDPETLRTTEVVFEQYLRGRLRLTVAGFYTDIEKLIDQVETEDGLVFHVNRGSANSTGVEVEAEHRSAAGTLIRGSVVVQRTYDEDTGETLSNAPSRLATLQIATPFLSRQLTVALDSTLVGSRLTLTGTRLGAFVRSNLITTWHPGHQPFFLQGGVHNLFDRAYADVVGAEFVQDAIPQDGRTVSIKLGVGF